MTAHSYLFWTAVSLVLAPLAAAAPAPREEPRLDAATAERFANLALACVHKEYPNKIAHALNGDADVKRDRACSPRPSTAATTGIRPCTGTGCWPGWQGSSPAPPSPPRPGRPWSRA